jgi:hypothetical protein
MGGDQQEREDQEKKHASPCSKSGPQVAHAKEPGVISGRVAGGRKAEPGERVGQSVG